MCTHPNFGIRVLDAETGALTVKFVGSVRKNKNLPDYILNHVGSNIGDYVLLPCGKCKECRISKAREWAIRLMHENQMHDKSCFLTLTYNDFYLPADNSLHVDHVQKFLKSYRQELDLKHDHQKIRFYCCGEYGSKSFRPHYHLIVFGDDFSYDRKEWSLRHGYQYFRSDTLERLWPFGFSVIGSVTNDSVMYVARYVTKKITGDLAEYYYDGLKPEFATMSRRPGIAHDWLLKYSGDIYNYDKCFFKGFEFKPPSYYDRIFSCLHPHEFQDLKDKRQERMISANEKLLERCPDLPALNEYFDGRSELAESKIKKVKGYEKL